MPLRALEPALIRYAGMAVALALACFAHVEAGTALGFERRWELLTGSAPEGFEDVRFLFAALPRAAIAVMIGAALGLVGSVLQQATQNRLVSPLTLGASSGAWLALVAGTIFAPNLAGAHPEWFSMAGALAATGLVVLIAGSSGMSGLPIVLAGMAANILFGSIAAGLALLSEERTRNLFIWGTGDLTQTDWSWVTWLLPRLTVALLILVAAPRPLMLLRLGEQGAAARGLPVRPVLLCLLLGCLWLTASAVTAVGVIGFVALLAPNMAALIGARRSFDEMTSSALIGAFVLVATDMIALLASRFTADLVPTGASAALIGAPALILLMRSRVRAQDHTGLFMLEGRAGWGWTWVGILAALLGVFSILSIALTPSPAGWLLEVPDSLTFGLRWPRMMTALAAGAGMAMAGVILQRLIRNPLASPDILGMSQGATLGLVASVVMFNGSTAEGRSLAALLGSAGVLVLLLALGRRHHFAAGPMALVGISVAALMDALVQFALASGSDAAFAILNWLGGSTYRATAPEALWLLCGVTLAFVLCLALHRWLTLLSAGDGIAAGRGLPVGRARLVLLASAALITGFVTAVMGPIAFVGLLAPHLAHLAGAKSAKLQLITAVLAGCCLMLLSDWLSRALIYPAQLPAGIVASVLGGSFFLALLARSRRAAL